MPSFDISIDLSQLLNTVPELKRELFPRLHDAVGTIAQQAMEQWMEEVQNARLWQKEKEDYLKSIKWSFTGDFSAEVRSDYKLAADIETGRPERDLKGMLDTSMKVRRTEDGRRFLVIPFRHNTPGSEATGRAMPMEVYQRARQMAKSSITGHGKRPSGEVTALHPRHGMRPSAKQTPFASDPRNRRAYEVTRRHYQWGDRMSKSDLRGMDKNTKRRFQGLYRFEASSGSESRSKYMTFRTMMEGSKGWVVPAKPGLYIARGIAERLRPAAEEIFSEALRLDLGL